MLLINNANFVPIRDRFLDQDKISIPFPPAMSAVSVMRFLPDA